MKSVYIERCKDAPHCLTMIWNENVQASDVKEAFAQLKQELDAEDSAQNVIIRLNGRVNFPLNVTTINALAIHNHPNLKSWLVIGKDNPLARIIANVLSTMNNDKKILWFNSTENIHSYLMQQAK